MQSKSTNGSTSPPSTSSTSTTMRLFLRMTYRIGTLLSSPFVVAVSTVRWFIAISSSLHHHTHGALSLCPYSVYAVATSLEVTEISYGGSSAVSPTVRSALPQTTLTFKQTIKYSTIDPTLTTLQVVTQPFSSEEYRRNYAEFLKNSLSESFGLLASVPAIAQTGSTNPSVLLADTFFCGRQLPVECGFAQSCDNDSDCPPDQDCLIEASCALPSATAQQAEPLVQQSTPQTVSLQRPVPVQSQPVVQQSAPQPALRPVPVQKPNPSPATSPNTSTSQSASSRACNICNADQVGINNQINFNGRLTDCAEVYDFVAKNYNEGSDNCNGAREALGSTCCRDADGVAVTQASRPKPTSSYSTPSNPTAPAPLTVNRPTNPNIPAATRPTSGVPVPSTQTAVDESPSSPTKITVTVALTEDPNSGQSSADEPEYPRETYFCGTSCKFQVASSLVKHLVAVGI